jgi:ATP-dependent RNA helicase RhlE
MSHYLKGQNHFMRFEELHLIDPLLRAVADQGYTEPTPIQVQAIPEALTGRDVIGLAQTGTGKTASFALPMLQQLAEHPDNQGKRPRKAIQALILAPTRELASQISASVGAYGKHTNLRHMTIFGGVSQRTQVKQLRQGVNIVVATPGRLLDLTNQGEVHFKHLEILILDEADRMLDMGFLPDIKRILAKLPAERQTMFFSATMSKEIRTLADEILTNPLEVAVARETKPVDAIEQSVYFVEKGDKRKLLVHLIEEHNMFRVLVFTRTKRGANRLGEQLSKAKIPSEAIHGNKSNNARQRALAAFTKGKVQVLVATDIVARGIDVDDITHVINYDLPNESESYVHRIGRTGRAGSDGIAMSFCGTDERGYLKDIERLMQMHIPVVAEHPYQSSAGMPEPTNLAGRHNGSSKNKGKSGGGRNRSNAHRSKPRNQRRGNKSGQGQRNPAT